MYLHLLFLGRVPYRQGLRVMEQVAAARREGRIGDTLLLLEHEPVLTLGRNAHRENLLASEELLARKGVEVVETNRGGDITYHGPGQLVGYPVVDLRGELPGKRGPHLGPVDFVRLLEEVLIYTSKDFGVLTQRIPGRTGVWTLAGGSIAEKKIAAIGIHVSQAVTTHGFALNVTTDLRDFDWIVPCGISDRGVTSLEAESNLTQTVDLEHAADAVARNFFRVFGRQVLAAASTADLLTLGLAPPAAKRPAEATPGAPSV